MGDVDVEIALIFKTPITHRTQTMLGDEIHDLVQCLSDILRLFLCRITECFVV